MSLRTRAAASLSLCLLLTACSNAADQAEGDPENAATRIPKDLSAAKSEPVDDPYYPDNGEPYFDALHYDLTLDWDPSETTLSGKAAITFRVTEPRDEVELDFGEPLEVTSATLDGNRIDAVEDGEQLVLQTPGIKPDSLHTLTIEYAGTPEPVATSSSRSDMPMVGWTTESDGGAWTMQEPWGAYTWYPVNDHPSDKAYYSATVTTHDAMTAVFNGRLTDSREDADATTTSWTLDEPAASYLITIAIGDYSVTSDDGPDGLPLTYWTRPEDEQQLPRLEQSPEILEWLEEQLGPYPFDSAGIVIVPSRSGMETQTMVTLGSGVRMTDDDYVSVIAHEYAHQWLGDTVTPNNWKDLWLNEGLTMYIEALWNDHVGTASYESLIKQWAASDDLDRSTYGPPGEYRKTEFASNNVYLSGAVMLDHIRDAVGEEVFANALRGWPEAYRNESVDREDFITYFSDATGTDIGPFVNDWLTSPTTPRGPVVPAP
ncbi:M1 family metallopeptidase [Solicola gregarius]|uniref:Aminopeptidase N n=1 Tax=Solicola gregarius TaxID=2908642 RepID=A0AA46YLX1_9ACTN|nr:M1 family metallopeptidase [Solicola gregarius]UYM07122.1 M1 family metallopeptidase [Solicola gregarius]